MWIRPRTYRVITSQQSYTWEHYLSHNKHFFIFTYTLCSKFLLFTVHYIPMKVLFDLKESMVWILTWLINVCGVIFLVFGILSWDYKYHLFCFTVLHLIYMWDICLFSILFYSHMFESVTPFSEWFYLLSVNNCEIWVEA